MIDAVLLDQDSRVVVTHARRPRAVGRLPELRRADHGADPHARRPAARSSRSTSRPASRRRRSSSSSCSRSCCSSACSRSSRGSAQDGGAGGIAGFSNFNGKGRKRGAKARATASTFDDVAGAGEAVAELREIRDYLADPSKYLDARRGARRRACCWSALPAPARRCSPRPPRARPTRPSSRVSGAEFVESLVGVGAARVRDLFAQGAQDGAGDHLHRRARRRRPQARRRHRPGQRRARADAQPAARRDGRLRRRRRRRRDGAPPTAPTSSTRRCCARAASTARSTVDTPDVHGRCEILQPARQAHARSAPDADLDGDRAADARASPAPSWPT